jgi:hypothetical protein
MTNTTQDSQLPPEIPQPVSYITQAADDSLPPVQTSTIGSQNDQNSRASMQEQAPATQSLFDKTIAFFNNLIYKIFGNGSEVEERVNSANKKNEPEPALTHEQKIARLNKLAKAQNINVSLKESALDPAVSPEILEEEIQKLNLSTKALQILGIASSSPTKPTDVPNAKTDPSKGIGL